MNRIQKIAWVFVIAVSMAVILSAVAVSVLYVKFGMSKAGAGLAFLGIAGFGGLAPLFFKKDKGPVTRDERDRKIARRSALAGFTAAYLLVGLACMVPFFVNGPHATVQIIWLPMIFMAAGIAHYFFYSVAILIQYGRGLPPRLSSRDEAAGGKQNE